MASYTTNEEMREFEDRDPTIHIVGYVDSFTSPAPAGKNQEVLFKFVITNGEKRITILIWGKTLIQQYFKEISTNRIIQINGAHSHAVVLPKYMEDQGFIPFEILIKENSQVNFLGYHAFGNEDCTEIKDVDFNSIRHATGFIRIGGYIRTKFSIMHNRNGNGSYGLGAVSNGQTKIIVQVKHFTESTLEVGDFVTLTGAVKDQDDLIKVYCNSLSDVIYDPSKEPLSNEAILRGGRVVKRVRRRSEG